MKFIQWFLVGFFAMNALIAILSIGKPRTPVTPMEAAWTVVVSIIFAVLVVRQR